MVLVRHRCPEQREDAIAGELHHVTVVAPHRLDHQLQRRIDNRARLLRVELFHQLGRALDIGEQRCDRLALAIDNLRCRNRVTQLKGSWLGARRGTWRGCANRGAAFATEAFVWLEWCAAFWTRGDEWCPAACTEFAPFAIITATFRTAHIAPFWLRWFYPVKAVPSVSSSTGHRDHVCSGLV